MHQNMDFYLSNYRERGYSQRRMRHRRKQIRFCISGIFAVAVVISAILYGYVNQIIVAYPKVVKDSENKNKDSYEVKDEFSVGEDTEDDASATPGGIEDAFVNEDVIDTSGAYDFSQPVPESETVDNSYFADAVFLGDSRTEGLIINTGLVEPTTYAYKGLMVDTVFTEPVVNYNGSKIAVMDALKNTSFSKVYIMFGINETGWLYDSYFVDKYEEIIDEIREINPDAIIYIQEILPVSAEVSDTHSYISNERIEELNLLLKDIADRKQVYYVDTVTAVSDSYGNLPDEAATDGIHLTRDYCEKWLEYLKSHTVQPDC